jgi:signal peptidase I
MFQPRYIQHSHLLIRHAEKLIRYRRDLLPEATIAELRSQIERVSAGIKARDQRTTHDESEKLDALLTRHTPPHRHVDWRENVEVILVAIVVAIGIRSYFINPLKSRRAQCSRRSTVSSAIHRRSGAYSSTDLRFVVRP